jgi:hypothetical protein
LCFRQTLNAFTSFSLLSCAIDFVLDVLGAGAAKLPEPLKTLLDGTTTLGASGPALWHSGPVHASDV